MRQRKGNTRTEWMNEDDGTFLWQELTQDWFLQCVRLELFLPSFLPDYQSACIIPGIRLRGAQPAFHGKGTDAGARHTRHCTELFIAGKHLENNYNSSQTPSQRFFSQCFSIPPFCHSTSPSRPLSVSLSPCVPPTYYFWFACPSLLCMQAMSLLVGGPSHQRSD